MPDFDTHIAIKAPSAPPPLVQVMAVTLLAGIVLLLVFGAGKAAATASLLQPLKYYTETVSDFGGLARYQAADSALPPPAGDRVVFMGDSITDFWPLPQYFPGEPYINRGISGQTTSQMLVRFRQDVLELHPRAVVILGGANDIMGHTGPMTSDQTEANIETMAELAHAHAIQVVMCSMLPVGKGIWPPSETARIAEVNAGLRQFAAQHGYDFIDYYSAMANSADNSLPRSLSNDGIHPLPNGYLVMAPLVKDVLNQEGAFSEGRMRKRPQH